MNPEALHAFITKTAEPELLTLNRLGGPGLAHLATQIYFAFGSNPGEDEMIAQHLSILPMEIRDRLPSFLYRNRWGRMRPLWRAVDPRARGTLNFTIRSTVGGVVDVSPMQTPITDAFLRGAAKMHDVRGRHQSDGMLRLHIAMITGRTAAIKGLLW